jgi:hypothetical protein
MEQLSNKIRSLTMQYVNFGKRKDLNDLKKMLDKMTVHQIFDTYPFKGVLDKPNWVERITGFYIKKNLKRELEKYNNPHSILKYYGKITSKLDFNESFFDNISNLCNDIVAKKLLFLSKEKIDKVVEFESLVISYNKLNFIKKNDYYLNSEIIESYFRKKIFKIYIDEAEPIKDPGVFVEKYINYFSEFPELNSGKVLKFTEKYLSDKVSGLDSILKNSIVNSPSEFDNITKEHLKIIDPFSNGLDVNYIRILGEVMSFSKILSELFGKKFEFSLHKYDIYIKNHQIYFINKDSFSILLEKTNFYEGDVSEKYKFTIKEKIPTYWKSGISCGPGKPIKNQRVVVFKKMTDESTIKEENYQPSADRERFESQIISKENWDIIKRKLKEDINLEHNDGFYFSKTIFTPNNKGVIKMTLI